MMGEVAALTRLDSFPYRHRVTEVMARPVLAGPPDLPLSDACERMNEAGTSAIVIVDADGRAIGIVTERDILRHLARTKALAARLSEIMSSPVYSLPRDAFLYLAITRLTRLDLSHLVVIDDKERPVGMVTARSLLQLRTSQALIIGDDVEKAESGIELARAKDALPRLALGLLAEGIAARDIAAVISAVLQDITARAAILCEDAMAADGWGPPPAAFALLLLGSGGRDESLLAFDQDNAIVHTGPPETDVWFAEFGRRLNDILHTAGIPYCPGEVMARNAAWRRSLEDWRTEIRRWVFEPKMETVLSVDIFFDFQPVHGDRDLARELKRYAIETAANSAFFVQFLAINVSRMGVPLGAFGRFITRQGRLDAKKYGLMPLVSAARAMAVKRGLLVSTTAERYSALGDKFHEDDLAGLLEAHDTLLRVILEQQLADLAQGRAASTTIVPGALSHGTQRKLKDAFQRIDRLGTLIAGF